MNRILIGGFIILLIVIIIEVGFIISITLFKKSVDKDNLYFTQETFDDRGYLQWLDKREKVMTSSIMIDRSSGRILDILPYSSSSEHMVKLTIEGKGGNYTFSLPLSQLKVYQIINNKKELYNFSDLKRGDRVDIEEVFNTLPDKIEIIEVTIIKNNSK